jgi:RNA polymerase sigma-70 factor (ECF subfamily)
LIAKDLVRLFVAHRRELHAYLTARLRDRDVAADLTQEVFLRYAEQAGKATVSHERSYLYRTAHNLAIDYVRALERRRTDTVPEEAFADIADERPGPEDIVDARERLQQLRAVIGELPPLTQRIFDLHRLQELTYGEVAAQLGISESSVQKHLAKSQVHIARRLPDSAGIERGVEQVAAASSRRRPAGARAIHRTVASAAALLAIVNERP